MRRIALLLLLSVCGTSVAAQETTDLAALARKEKERRAKVAKPAKVLTEEDGREAAVHETGAVTTVTPVTSDTPVFATVAPSGDSERQAWKRRIDLARKAAAAAQAQLAAMQVELERYRSDLSVVPADEAMDPLRLQKRAARIEDMVRAVEAQRAAVEAARKMITDLEEQARREGVSGIR